jgi:hypothetical protein
VRPSNPALAEILQYLGSQAVRRSDPELAAKSDNYLFEERVQTDRQHRYETGHPPAGTTYEDWLESHTDYLQASVFRELPETFGSINAQASLPSAVMSDLAGQQFLIRVECLDHALTHTKVDDLEHLAHNLAVYSGESRDNTVTQGDAKALLEEVCRSLNSNPYAVRPRFAAFAEEMQDEISAPDWANRLRDRLGLAHYPSPSIAFATHPVALMRYRVEEVTKRARQLKTDIALTVPTVLDSEPYEIFHPAPKESNFGRTLNLSGCGDECERLASEVMHLRIDYQPKHILKVGAITTRADLSPGRVTGLREQHLFCLRYLNGNEKFGTL